MSQKPLNKIGAHISIAGGIENAPKRAFDAGCETFQCFTRPPQSFQAPIVSHETILVFKKAIEDAGMKSFYIHTPYIINLASIKPGLRHTSRIIIRQELDRGSSLGATYVMTHVGSHKDQSEKEGIEKVIDSIDKLLDGYSGTTQLLIEISAGSGAVIGDSFEEIGEMVKHLDGMPGFGGVCFDTCHAFASGYDFRTREHTETLLDKFDKSVGLKWLKLAHVNDSKFDFDQKKDRHEHIGKGFIGLEGFRELLGTEAFRNIDWILETEDDDRTNDLEALKKIRDGK